MPRHSGKLFVHYGLYFIDEGGVSEEDSGVEAIHRGNTLVATSEGRAVLKAGTHTGDIRLTVDVVDAEPEMGGLDAWDVVVETTYVSPAGRAGIVDWNASGHPEFGVLTASGPGTYRMRVHARGRDAGHRADTPGEPVEDHLIVIWSAAPAGEVVYKIDVEVGEMPRAECGARHPERPHGAVSGDG